MRRQRRTPTRDSSRRGGQHVIPSDAGVGISQRLGRIRAISGSPIRGSGACLSCLRLLSRLLPTFPDRREILFSGPRAAVARGNAVLPYLASRPCGKPGWYWKTTAVLPRANRVRQPLDYGVQISKLDTNAPDQRPVISPVCARPMYCGLYRPRSYADQGCVREACLAEQRYERSCRSANRR